MEKDLNILEESIGYKFNNRRLLITALTHTSYANERKLQSNEKLEFLGDSVLQLVTSTYIYQNYKNLKEGEMTKVRASVVCGESLVEVAQKHNFSDFLFLGRAEIRSDNKKSLVEDCVESIIAAIYLDGGFEFAKKFILENLEENICKATKNIGTKDYKTTLQEALQKNGDVKIDYELLVEEGPDHNKTFEVEVKLEGKRLATGKGKSKKIAQMEAAKKALEIIKGENV